VEKPVVPARLGLAKKGRKMICERHILGDDTDGVRAATVEQAFAMIRAQFREDPI
jgi:hypothetical protein